MFILVRFQSSQQSKDPSGSFAFKYTYMKQEVTLEIRAAEGGQDSKLLVNDMRDIYVKTAKTNNFN